MATPQSQLKLTPAQYLAFEREAEERHEYDNGQISAMAGESPNHSRICVNISREISASLKGKSCEAFSPNMKIRLGPANKFYYPDLSVVCGGPSFHDQRRDVITNPRVVFEALSPSTERKDRSEKLRDYQQIVSLTDYVLISQDQPLIEHFARREGNQWLYTSHTGLEADVHLASIDCHLQLSEIYDRVEFPVLEDSGDKESDWL